LRGRDNRGNVTNVQYKSNRNCPYESPPYNEYILIKFIKKLIFSGILSQQQKANTGSVYISELSGANFYSKWDNFMQGVDNLCDTPGYLGLS
jgi:hypothetical protein